MVDSADPGFYGAAWRFTDFCQQLSAGSVHLQFVLKSCELLGVARVKNRGWNAISERVGNRRQLLIFDLRLRRLLSQFPVAVAL